MEQAYAVLTGDLIASSKASPLRLATTMANLAETGQILTKLTGSDTRFTRFRGDGWQMLIADPGKPEGWSLSVAWIGCAGIVDCADSNRNAGGQRFRGRAQSGKDEGDCKQVFSGVGDEHLPSVAAKSGESRI